MTHDTEQSDGDIVAMKGGEQRGASPGGVAGAKDPDQEESATHGHGPDPGSGSGDPGAERIRQFAKENPGSS